MTRVRCALAATLVGVSFAGSALALQTAAPPMTSVLAGKKFTPPFKGAAEIQFTKPVTKKEKELVVTTFQVRNMSPAPIARFTVDETWYDDKGNVITGGKGVIMILQPNEVQTMRIETGWNPKMKSNNWNFTHANGTVKVAKVKTLDVPKDAAAAKAAPPKK